MSTTTLFNVTTPARHVVTTKSKRRALRKVAKAHRQGARLVFVHEIDLANTSQALLLKSERNADPTWYEVELTQKG
jgi:ATP-dependent Clp protease adapter protein ClpS